MGLVARVGDGPATFIGARRTVLADRPGSLELSVNDGYLADNGGSFDATIAVRCPSRVAQ
jgi:hypothetical protein